MAPKKPKRMSKSEAIKYLRDEIEKLEIKKLATDDIVKRIQYRKRQLILKRNLENIQGKRSTCKSFKEYCAEHCNASTDLELMQLSCSH